MPNIMKIRQCFLKLQLKMSGMFFETHCSYSYKVNVFFQLIPAISRPPCRLSTFGHFLTHTHCAGSGWRSRSPGTGAVSLEICSCVS